ncbi:ATP-grasp domain-containing protein [uncultured Treponema sp.]|uniref:ATP-grasp domain-containing protein n=1 Tax=uncultured Treponema sp. TaxID=162155 RepID=UPI0025CC2FA4|nr:ATP-grasp domain-containing protein [uncultured Treponema sp.]
MRILFYSTSSNVYDGNAIKTTTLPSWKEQWESLAQMHAEHEFIIATQLPGMFLVDVEGNEIASKSSKIEYHIINSDKEKEIAEELAALKPELAIALSFYVMPYDWLTVKDALVADFLREKGIRTICHPVESGLICFDKWRTHEFLEKHGINCAKAVHLNHELYINAGNRRELKSNVYTDAVFHEIKKLNFPVIIKDTTGLSSFGADVVNTYDEALGILRSKKTTSDRIIEEMIAGEQFGCEIYGTYDEKNAHQTYTIFPPFKFSVNQYGITSPKQSVKFGPFGTDATESEYYKIRDLNEMLSKLAEELKLDGIAQVDLVFTGEKWFVIEINPRLSGMSTTYAASTGMPLSEMIFEKLKVESGKRKTESSGESLPLAPIPLTTQENAEQVQPSPLRSAISATPSPRGDSLKTCLTGFAPKGSFPTPKTPQFQNTLNIKFPILARGKLLELKSLPYIAFVNQIENRAARQIREQGYCEVILCGETKDELRNNLNDLSQKFSDVMEKSFFDTAMEMLKY